MALFDSIRRWNLWGSWLLPESYKRLITNEIYKFTEIEEVLVITGPRRAGKSTILYQIMKLLQESGIDEKAILHVNFEEPSLSPYLALSLLDEIYDLYRS